MLRILQYCNIINKMEQELSKYDFMKDFILRNVNGTSEIIINYGKKETDFIFNTKIKQINNDIIPIINSIFHEEIKSFYLKNVEKYYFEDYIYEVENIDKSSLSIPIFNNFIKNNIIKKTYKSKLKDYEFYNKTSIFSIDEQKLETSDSFVESSLEICKFELISFNSINLLSLISVAITSAPSLAKAIAVALPIP